MTLYEIFKYTEEEIKIIEDLFELSKKLEIEEKVQEHIFQFSPQLLSKDKQIEGFGEHESWFDYHKICVINEIVYKLLEMIINDEFDREYYENKQIFDGVFTKFLLDNIESLNNETVNIIIHKFKNEMINV